MIKFIWISTVEVEKTKWKDRMCSKDEIYGSCLWVEYAKEIKYGKDLDLPGFLLEHLSWKVGHLLWWRKEQS
jgi:hypothetical protein